MANLEVLGKRALDRQDKMFRPFVGTVLQDYLTDAAQRYILFLNILRQRGNEEEEITSRPLATVLTFDHEEALSFVIKWTQSSIEDVKLVGAGHRIVLGGTRFEAPVLIDDEVLSYLESLSAMEPSHQPYNVAGARVIAKAFGKMHQVGCFDTSFHRTMPEISEIYAVPKELSDLGVRHWGYHGISYDYISRKLKNIMPGARRAIAAHLGGGCSICALRDGKSMDTSMGFAGLSGLPMATRTGDLPPEIVFYLMRQGSYTLDSLENVL